MRKGAEGWRWEEEKKEEGGGLERERQGSKGGKGEEDVVRVME